MKKRLLTVLCVGVLSISCCITAFAAYSSTLEYKGVKATAELIPQFQWKIIDSDKANRHH